METRRLNTLVTITVLTLLVNEAAAYTSLSEKNRRYYFLIAAGQDEQIDSDELEMFFIKATPTHQPFKGSLRILRSLDRDNNGKMGYSEYKEFLDVLAQWGSTFKKYDSDKSGSIEKEELQAAITGLGYRLSPQALNVIIKSVPNEKLRKDDFMGVFITLRSMTDQFRRRDTDQTGNACFAYDDFIEVAFSAYTT